MGYSTSYRVIYLFDLVFFSPLSAGPCSPVPLLLSLLEGRFKTFLVMAFSPTPDLKNCVTLVTYFADSDYDFVDFFVRGVRAVDNLLPLYSIGAQDGLKALAVAFFSYDKLNTSDFEGHLRRVFDALVSCDRIEEEYEKACKAVMR